MESKVKLSQLRPTIGRLPPLFGPLPGDERERARYRRDSAEPWQKWYYTARWKRLRMSILVRDLFTCAECGKIEGNSANLVAHHKTPHKGDEALFWDDGNLTCVCRTCHDGPIQKRERANADR
ncbi:HNH endonuclease [Rhizobium sp. PP-CC-3G-465]|uniref:HNH endonuclease n=1 Tax=Rhizobium sp. PP-CC-3G-465 TaxID=2135648 RepID=UPI0010528E8F|nr:hypothetical protein C8J33_101886 [Rhizobium sp. PP-CC-3G-465]